MWRQLSVVNDLIKAGVDVNHQREVPFSAAQRSAAQRSAAQRSALVTQDGLTALIAAAFNGRDEIAQALLKARAQVDQNTEVRPHSRQRDLALALGPPSLGLAARATATCRTAPRR